MYINGLSFHAIDMLQQRWGIEDPRDLEDFVQAFRQPSGWKRYALIDTKGGTREGRLVSFHGKEIPVVVAETFEGNWIAVTVLPSSLQLDSHDQSFGVEDEYELEETEELVSADVFLEEITTLKRERDALQAELKETKKLLNRMRAGIAERWLTFRKSFQSPEDSF